MAHGLPRAGQLPEAAVPAQDRHLEERDGVVRQLVGHGGRQKATEAWEKIQANTKPTEAAQKARNEAYLTMEEANWEDAVMIPLDHPYEDRMSYDWVDVPMFGGGGRSRQRLNTAKFTGERN